MKDSKIMHTGIFQCQGKIDIFQRFAAIAVEIPKGMIQVKEKMLVLHVAIYCLFKHQRASETMCAGFGDCREGSIFKLSDYRFPASAGMT
jgi:hypothetical protein